MATKEELLANRAEREAKVAKEREANELLCLELEEKYSAELGLRGRAFEIVNEDNTGGVGPIVLKTPTLLAQKSYTQSDAKLTPEVAQAFVNPCVLYPASEVVAGIFNARHQMCLRCVIALSALSGFSDGEQQKKF
jgi:hypothetical protein